MTLESNFLTFPQVVSENLVLRRIAAQDTEALFGILGDEEVTRYYDDETFRDLSQARDQIEAWEKGYQARRCLRWGITRKGDDRLIGTCGYYGYHTLHRRAGMGYELARSHWRKGIMTEALEAIIEHGFREMDLNRIEAVVMPDNEASLRLLEKLGFRQEGVLHEYENWGGKGFTDLSMLALLRKARERG